MEQLSLKLFSWFQQVSNPRFREIETEICRYWAYLIFRDNGNNEMVIKFLAKTLKVHKVYSYMFIGVSQPLQMCQKLSYAQKMVNVQNFKVCLHKH
jgi:hypothetical protein